MIKNQWFSRWINRFVLWRMLQLYLVRGPSYFHTWVLSPDDFNLRVFHSKAIISANVIRLSLYQFDAKYVIRLAAVHLQKPLFSFYTVHTSWVTLAQNVTLTLVLVQLLPLCFKSLNMPCSASLKIDIKKELITCLKHLTLCPQSFFLLSQSTNWANPFYLVTITA